MALKYAPTEGPSRRENQYFQRCNDEERTDDCTRCFDLFYTRFGPSLTHNVCPVPLQQIISDVYEHMSEIAQLHACECGGLCRAATIGLTNFRHLCRISYKKLLRVSNSGLTNQDGLVILSSLYIINYQSLAESEKLENYVDARILRKLLSAIAQLLNDKECVMLKAVSLQNTDDFYQEKINILVNLITKKAQEGWQLQINLYFIQQATGDLRPDPPGQRSIYIPPGNEFSESYRLSTFIKYPQDVPINPRQLASSGFYYSGYKDRVKCFSCSKSLHLVECRAVDFFESDVCHENDCKFIKNLDSGNIPVGQEISGHPRQAVHIYNDVKFATTSMSHEHFLRTLDLRKESERLTSFKDWPCDTAFANPNDLARSGFFYLGNLDRVQCFSCCEVLSNWNIRDNVDFKHSRTNPNCRMVLGEEELNESLSPEERVIILEKQISLKEPKNPSKSEQEKLQKKFPCRFPKNPHMRDEEARFQTFDRRWESNNVKATSRQIARAGFFYLGVQDRVKCFYCGGGLKNWEWDDEPWTEHAKWYPQCEFVLQRKGPDFVHRVVSLFPNLPRPRMGGQYYIPPHDRHYQIGRDRSQPPQIIDPQEEIRREDARIDNAMRSDLVSAALDLGFDRSLVRRVVERRVRESVMYTSVQDLVADLADAEASDSDEDRDDVPGSSESLHQPFIDGEGGETSASSIFGSDQSIDEIGTSMQSRIQELRDARMCKVCLVRPAEMIFIPCGHMCYCATCIRESKNCPICGRVVRQVAKLIT